MSTFWRTTHDHGSVCIGDNMNDALLVIAINRCDFSAFGWTPAALRSLSDACLSTANELEARELDRLQEKAA